MRVIGFDGYEVWPVRDFEDSVWGKLAEVVFEHQAEYWSLFGHIPGQGVEWLKDFPTREAAEVVQYRLKGRTPAENFIRYEVSPGEWDYDGVTGGKQHCTAERADFWTVFGVDHAGQYTEVAEMKTKELAEQVLLRLTGATVRSGC